MVKDIIEVEDLKRDFSTKQGTLIAVNGVSFKIKQGEIFGLVGESGSGKSTIGFMISGAYKPTSGVIKYKGKDITKDYKKRNQKTKKDIQLVFQDPGGSLNPRKTIRQNLFEPAKLYLGKNRNRKELESIIEDVMDKVGLPLRYLYKYPTSIGGGEKQLVCIARALIAEPSFIVLDEPTSALDVSIQAKITNKLKELQKKENLSYLFITHNLCLVRNICDRLAIMYLGDACEYAETREFFRNPLHPYTKMLLSSIPVLSKEEEELKPMKSESVGEIPNPINRPEGCSFHTRCVFKKDICSQKVPEMKEISPGHYVSCHLY